MISVTITGADDAVDPNDLSALSQEFPFVEWGILFSAKRAGSLRYPSAAWIERFVTTYPHLQRAAHLCGFYASDAMEGRLTADAAGAFHRIQLNGYKPGRLMGIAKLSKDLNAALILQARSAAELQDAATEASQLPSGQVLFDPSGGRGQEPFDWPKAPNGARIGYAGGINPGNVEAVVCEILTANNFTLTDFWIDMESGVRTRDNHFNLDAVRRVLETVSAVNYRMKLMGTTGVMG